MKSCRSFLSTFALAGFGWLAAPLSAQTITFTNGQNSTTAYDASGSALTFTIASGTATQSGVVTGAAGIVKTGAGTLLLTGAADNSALIATVNAGTLVLAKDSTGSVHALGGGGTSATINSGGTLQLGGTGNDQIFSWASVAVNSGGTFDLNGHSEGLNNLTGAGTVTNTAASTTGTLTLGENGGSATFDGVLQNGAGILALTKTGNGTLTLTGANTFTGATTVGNGALALLGSGRLGDTTALTVAANATFVLNGITDTIGSLAGAGTVTFGAGVLTAGGDNTSTTFSGTLTGSGTLTKTGTGTLTLGGTADNFNMTTVVNAGTLVVAKTSTSSVHGVGIAATVNSGGTLQLGGTGGDQIYANVPVTLNSGGTLDLNGRNEGFDTLTGSGTVTNTAASTTGTLTLGENNGNATFSGVLQNGAGTLALTKTGNGTLTLTSANTYTGATTVGNGTVALSGSGRLADTTALTVASGATFNINGVTDTIGSLAGAGTVTLVGGTLTVGGDNTSTTFTGTVTGNGTLTKAGNGTLTLGGTTNNTNLSLTVSAGPLLLGKTSGASVHAVDSTAMINSGGTLQLGGTGGDQLGSGVAVTLNSGGTLDLNSRSESFDTLTGGGTVTNTAASTTGTLTLGENQGSSTFSGVLQNGNGTLALAKAGNGTLTLSGANTYTGGTTISAGTLALGASNVLANSGAVTISGGTLSLGNFSETAGSVTLVSGNITSTTGVLTGSSYDLRSGNVSAILGGAVALTKTTAGTVTLSGANTHTGGTAINAGTLALASSGALGGNGTISFGGGTLQFSAGNFNDYSARFSTASNQAYSFDTNGQDVTLASPLTSSGGTLTKSGNGTLTLSGSNTYPGGTALNGGVLALGSSGALGGNGTISFGGGTLQFSAANHGDYSSLLSTASNQLYRIDTNGQNVTFASSLNNPGGTLTKTGNGTLTLTGNSSSVGATYVEAGTLQIGAGGTTGSFPSTSITTSGTLIVNRSDNLTHTGSIYGSGALIKDGAGTLTLAGTYDYLGATTISAGTLQLSEGGGSIPDGSAVTVAAGATFDVNGTAHSIGSLAGSGQVFLGAGNLTIGGDQSTTTFSGGISGTGGVRKVGAGTVILSGNNSYTGGTVISSGTVQIGDGGAGGSLASSLIDLTGVGAGVVFNPGAAASYAGAIVGSGTVTKLGAGTLTLTGNVTLNGTLTISTGTLRVGDGSSSGGIVQNGTLSITNNGALIVNQSDDLQLTASMSVSGNGTLTQLGNGTLTISGNNSYTGSTTLAAGTLALGSNGALGTSGTLGSIEFSGGTLQFSPSNANDYSGRFSTAANQLYQLDTNGQNVTLATALVSSGGSLAKSGNGTLKLTAANTYTGGTSVAGGTLLLGHSLALQNSTLTAPAAGGLSFGTLTSATLGGLTGSNPLALTNASSAAVALTVGGNQADTTYTGVLSGGGSLRKIGPGTLTLGGANTYTGVTTLSAGTLALGNSGALGGTSTINFSGGTLQFSASNTNDYSSRFSTAAGQLYKFDTSHGNVTLANALTSSGGSLTVSGSGVLRLAGDNTYSGGTTISGGTLQIGAGGASGSIAGNVSNNANLAFNRSDAASYSGVISGSGSLTQAGTGTLTLNGANTFTGGTTLAAGTLALGSSGALGGNGTISFTGGTLQLSAGNTTDYSARFSTADGQAYKIDTNGQSISLATPLTSIGGTLTKLGNGTLTLTSSQMYLGSTTISAGALVIGSGGVDVSLSGNIVNNATLFFYPFSGMTFAGVISGNGTLILSTSGRLTLTGANTYTGGTTVSAGTLALSGAGTLGSGTSPLTVTVDGVFPFGGTLDLGGLAPTVGAVTLGGGSITHGTLSGASYTLQSGNVSATLAGTGALTKTTGGQVTLSSANTFSGPTTITAGTLLLNHSLALQNSTLTAPASGLSFGGLTSATLGGLTGSNPFSLTVALTVGNNNTDSAYSGVLSGSGSLVKSGTGKLTLSAISTYTGTTTVSGGQLQLDGSAANSAFTVNSGGILSGSGTVGALTIASGGTLSPGNSPGVLSAGATTWAGGGTLIFELNKTAGNVGATQGWDLLSISGALNLTATNANKFNLKLTSLAPGNLAGNVADFNSGSNYSFAFASATGGIIGFDASAFAVNTSGFTNPFPGTWSVNQIGNTLTLDYVASAIPEPSTWAAWAGGATLALAIGRRRRK